MDCLLPLLLSTMFAAGSCTGACAADAMPTTKREAATAWSDDGLQRVEVKDLDVVYTRPGSGLASYAKVWIRPITVAFRRDWGRGTTGSRLRVRSTDAERIKAKLAALVHDELLRQLDEGGYGLAEGPGDDVLDVQLSIIDLYLNAPDLPAAGRVETYAVSAGEMTLVAELRDSASGEVLARAFDHAKGRESMRPERITRVDNAADARAAAKAWAQALRRALDLARSTAPAAAD
jgi:hypothetical protein